MSDIENRRPEIVNELDSKEKSQESRLSPVIYTGATTTSENQPGDVEVKPQKPRFICVDYWNNTNFYVKVFIGWFVWIFSGTVTYCYRNELGWAKGFYMAVNVGYSIGWGYPLEKDDQILWYSIFHVLVGASAVAAALGFFAQSVIKSSRSWYQTALLEAQAKETNNLMKVWLWAKYNWDSLKIIFLWMAWISFMTIYTCNRVGWNFVDGLYNAISSLSTGGLWAIPSDSPEIDFFAIGFFSAIGVPLMALAMSHVAKLCISFGDSERAKEVIRSKVTKIELEMMQKFGLDDGDGLITRSEFILLCAVRIGAMDNDLIAAINDRFCQLDSSNNGYLTYDDILEEGVAGQVKPETVDAKAIDEVESDSEDEASNQSEGQQQQQREDTSKRPRKLSTFVRQPTGLLPV
jgi:hypothetical protein